MGMMMSKNKQKSNSDDVQNNITAIEYDEESLSKAIALLNQSHAYIEMRIDNEKFKLQDDPNIIGPAPLIEDESLLEYVYPIYDFGDRLLASKQSDSELNQTSMIKMYYTIEKMVMLWSEKIKAIDVESGELFFYLEGHTYCLRKAFEVIINLPDNWLIMNFDPGEWGNNYLATLQRLRKKDFAYPPPAPRDFYRHKLGNVVSKSRFNK